MAYFRFFRGWPVMSSMSLTDVSIIVLLSGLVLYFITASIMECRSRHRTRPLSTKLILALESMRLPSPVGPDLRHPEVFETAYRLAVEAGVSGRFLRDTAKFRLYEGKRILSVSELARILDGTNA